MSNLVPEGWYKSKLGLEAYLTMGQSPLSDTYNFEREGLPFFQGKTDFGTHRPKVRVWCNNPTKIAKKNSILFSVRAPVGEVNITDNDCCIGRGLAGIIGKTIDQSYLYQNIQFLKKMFILLAQGSTFEAVNGSELKEFPLILPPLPEQQKIAKILTSVDEVIEKTQAQIDKLKDLKTGMMQELLTHGIGHTEFKDSPVGRIPADWSVVKIADLCSHVVDCVNKTAPVVDFKTPYKMIRTTNVRHGRVDTENVRCVTKETFELWTRRLLPENGDLIFTREAPVGECGILKDSRGVFLGQRTMMYRASKARTSAEFLMYSIMSDYGKQQLEDFSGGSTVGHMRVPDCGRILIKTPPLDEQAKIVKLLGSVDTSILVKEKKLAKINHSKKALMQDLLTGKVRVKVDSEYQ
ncbi:restriction endonuclease subunit S [Pseudoalteromonas agarivorans]|uniref:Type I restriction enzyme, S subunit n=1 Tax=Pseudoalteromonas agarivorans DSM 14585 TaxID=1312369 RepID=A0ACA8DTZ3_9GAMM|nr:restriction endonuclease subunit S [Pseudoalteromonas agarivorans]ATC81453.1 type I restriction enzyme, S subunit [Pseudoalteromonas agarivorans DSM 14585]